MTLKIRRIRDLSAIVAVGQNEARTDIKAKTGEVQGGDCSALPEVAASVHLTAFRVKPVSDKDIANAIARLAYGFQTEPYGGRNPAQ